MAGYDSANIFFISLSSLCHAALVLGVKAKKCSEDPVKVCPGFRNKAKETHCCKSKVSPGQLYCCTWEEKEAEMGQNNGPNLAIILGVIAGGLVVLALVVLFFCYCRSCPLNQWRRKRREASMYHSGSVDSGSSLPPPGPVVHNPRLTMYHAISSREPPKPGIYEAPPPYPFAHRYPSNPVSGGGSGACSSPHWDNLLNEARVLSDPADRVEIPVSPTSLSHSDSSIIDGPLTPTAPDK